MHGVTAQLKKERRWWSKSVDLEFLVSAKIDGFDLTHVTDCLAGSLLGGASYRGEGERLLVNQKGKSSGNDSTLKISVPENEVLHVECEVAVSENEGEYGWQPGSISVYSELHEFTEALRYRLRIHHGGALSTDIPPFALGRVINLRPKLIRFTIESLELSWVSNLVGAAPQPTNRLTLFADERDFFAKFNFEGFRESHVSPFESYIFLNEVDRILSPVLGISLHETFENTPPN